MCLPCLIRVTPSIFLLTLAVTCAQQPTATTENGVVIGRLRTSYQGRSFRSFEGIPYAKPPVGDLRFKDPQFLEKKWIGEWNATTPGSLCLQFEHFTRAYDAEGKLYYETVGDEDCLFLNVHTPDTSATNKAVLVWIHGGAFMFGNGDHYLADYLMDTDDIVFVTFNYRVGPLGFLSTGDGIIPGNVGLKDQSAALKWIQRNIVGFGGDPGKVTLVGNSAGGASVHYHYLSPLSNGLFNWGYSLSGTTLCPWALVTDAPQKTKKLASILGCPTTDSKTILKCLRRRPARQIVSSMKHFHTWMYNPFTVFGPVVEVGSARPFIDQTPATIIEKGLAKDLPWVTGVTSEEGLYPAADFVDNSTLLKHLAANWESVAPSLLFFNASHPVTEHAEISRKLLKAYLGDKPISSETVNPLVQLISDRLFVVPAVRGASLQAQHNTQPVYAYVYRHIGTKSVTQYLSGTETRFGVCHGDDVILISNYGGLKSYATEEDLKMGTFLKETLVTFAKTGKVPANLNWTPVSKSSSIPFTYLNIKSFDDFQLKEDPTLGNVDVLQKILPDRPSAKDEF